MSIRRLREDLLQASVAQRAAIREQGLNLGRPRRVFLQTREVDADRDYVLGGHLMKLAGDPPPIFIVTLKSES